MGVKSKTAPAKIQADMLRAKAVQLRLAGFTMEEIGKQIGRSKAQVCQYLKKTMAEYARETEESVMELKRVEDARIERMIRGLWPKAIQGHMGAVDRIIKLIERQSRLHGLDKAQDKADLSSLIGAINIYLPDNNRDGDK